MKKYVVLVLVIIFIVGLVGYGVKTAISVKTPVDPEITISHANWSDDSRIYNSALNADKLDIRDSGNLPIYKFDTKDDLDQFKSNFGDILTMNYGYGTEPSFNDATAKYDEEFFKENTLMLVYVTASSGSYRFGVKKVFCNDKSYCIYIEQINNPSVYTCDMAGWFITVAEKDSKIANCTEFDAKLV